MAGTRVAGSCLMFIALLALIWPIRSELHRAKPAKKQGQSLGPVGSGGSGTTRFPPGAFSDYDNEATVTNEKSSDYVHEDTQNMTVSGHSLETWVYSIVSASLVGLSGIFPLLVIPLEAGKALRQGAPAARLKLLLSFAVGGLLGDVFLHLLPEAWAHLDKGHDHQGHMEIGLWVIGGIFTFLIIEKVFPESHDEEEEEGEEQTHKEKITSLDASEATVINSNQQKKSTRNRKNKTTDNVTAANGHVQKSHTNGNAANKTNGHISNGHSVSNGNVRKQESEQNTHQETTIKTSGWLNLMANIIDNFTHGLAVAGSYCISTKTGLITTAAVLLHEIPHEVGDFAILLRSGFDRWKAAKAQLVTASGGIFGALVALGSESAQAAGDRTAWILPFTSGGFIYIALVTVVPDILTETNNRQSALQLLLILLGIALVSGVTLLCE